MKKPQLIHNLVSRHSVLVLYTLEQCMVHYVQILITSHMVFVSLQLLEWTGKCKKKW